MAKDNSELIDVNSDVKDRVMEVSHIQVPPGVRHY